VTQNKSLKRRVRERMSKTGERYTSARRQVLARSDQPSLEAPAGPNPTLSGAAERAHDQPQATGESPAGNAAPRPTAKSADRGPSDETLAERTGHSWEAWLADLQSWGAADQPHREIARWLMDEHGVDGWWAQTLTVRYEKHIGRRVLGQRGGVFAASATRTIDAAPERVFEAFVDEDLRERWLPDVELSVRTATAPRNARFNVGDGRERLIVGIEAKPNDRSTVSIEHERLPDAAATNSARARWRERLTGLKELLEG
jgi:hypothetical protein